MSNYLHEYLCIVWIDVKSLLCMHVLDVDIGLSTYTLMWNSVVTVCMCFEGERKGIILMNAEQLVQRRDVLSRWLHMCIYEYMEEVNAHGQLSAL